MSAGTVNAEGQCCDFVGVTIGTKCVWDGMVARIVHLFARVHLLMNVCGRKTQRTAREVVAPSICVAKTWRRLMSLETAESVTSVDGEVDVSGCIRILDVEDDGGRKDL